MTPWEDVYMINGLSMTHDTHNPEQAEVIHFPDDRTPAAWHQPVLALGNSMGSTVATPRSSI